MQNILTKPRNILIVILIFAALSRFFRLDFPNKYVFDEVYHAFTAKEYLKANKAAWDPWAKPPPNVAYEWTHPPLAKEIMTVSMYILHSQDAWAWRLPGTILGIFSVYLVYLLGLKLLKNQNVSLIASFLFSIDGLNFVQSRIGMNDIYYVTFILLSLLFFLNKKYFYSSIFWGLALSSKWAAIYFILIIGPLLLFQKDRIKLLFYFTVSPAVYLISYIPYFSLGYSVEQFKQLQQQMWWYHTNLKATHNYSSPWWSWPFNLYPVWYFVDYKDNTIANIFASGNPFLFWLGSLTFLLTVYDFLKTRSKKLLLIILGVLIFWLPWFISPRIMFLYHFSPSVPFLSISLAYQLNKIYQKQKRLFLLLLTLMVVSFILIFPFLTGIHIPKNLINLFFQTNLSKNPFQ